jgi:hypothetical protein
MSQIDSSDSWSTGQRTGSEVTIRLIVSKAFSSRSPQLPQTSTNPFHISGVRTAVWWAGDGLNFRGIGRVLGSRVLPGLFAGRDQLRTFPIFDGSASMPSCGRMCPRNSAWSVESSVFLREQ